jgi:hypothetical protein
MSDPPARRAGGAVEAALELLGVILVIVGGIAFIATAAGLFCRIVVWAWSW